MKEKSNQRGRGAPVGNLNRARDCVPALTRVRQGKPLPASLQRVTQLAEMEAGELITDKGGLESMSGAQRLLIGAWKSARMAELLIWNEVLDGGSAVQRDQDGDSWDLMPGLQRLTPYLSVQHRVLTALGLKRKPKNITDLESYLKTQYGDDGEKKSGEEKS